MSDPVTRRKHSLAFARQFLITDEPLSHDVINHWHRMHIGCRRLLYYHPELAVSSCRMGECEMIGIGLFLDPGKPQATDDDILRYLASYADSFETLTDLLAVLSGRWVLCATIANESRIYTDATAQRTVFYVCWESSLFVASQPALLHRLGLTRLRPDIIAQFNAGRHSGSWPINRIPYDGVSQLGPNHYLSLNRRTKIRYWPNRSDSVGPLTRTDAAQKMCKILQGAISCAVNRGDCALSLTGGYDSRVILACAEKHWSDIAFFTLIRDDSPHHDKTIPKAIAGRYGLSHSFVRVDRTDGSALDFRLSENIGGMYLDQARYATTALHHSLNGRLHLPGLISEVNRCYYYEDGRTPADLSPGRLAALAGFKGNDVAERGFEQWLADCPFESAVHVLDLLYWEHRLGVWSACGLGFREAVIDQVPPMNCRRFLEIGLATSVEERKSPHRLIREIIACAKPELLEYKFNWDWVDGLHAIAKNHLPLPWRLKKAFGLTR